MRAFVWQNYEYTVKVYLFCNVRLNTESSQVGQAILTHGGSEIIFDELKLDEASADATVANVISNILKLTLRLGNLQGVHKVSLQFKKIITK